MKFFLNSTTTTETLPHNKLSLDHIGVDDVLTIAPAKGWSSLGLRDIWEYRELFYFMLWREIQGTYRQTALGFSWIIIRPIVNMIVLSVVFGRIVQVPSEGVPYPLFSLAALLPWTFFSTAALRASRSLVDNLHIVSKVYFPRMLIPLAGTASGLIDFAASFLVFLFMLLLYRMPLRREMVFLPVFLVVTFFFALAVGLWLATLAVKYRDVAFAVTFLLQVLMYASPVIYPVSMVPEALLPLYVLNPMTFVIEGFRWALLGIGEPPGSWALLSIAFVLIGLLTGAYVFRRTERTIVDYL